MITTNNIRMEKHETKFYAPMFFISNIANLLRDNDITSYVTSWRDLKDDKSSEIDRNAWSKKFETIGKGSIPEALGCITSHCNTNDLFEIAKQMTSDTIDPDFKKDIEIRQKVMLKDYEENYAKFVERGDK